MIEVMISVGKIVSRQVQCQEQDKIVLSGEHWRRMWQEDHGCFLWMRICQSGWENYQLPV
jgi:hypothetical protein